MTRYVREETPERGIAAAQWGVEDLRERPSPPPGILTPWLWIEGVAVSFPTNTWRGLVFDVGQVHNDPNSEYFNLTQTTPPGQSQAGLQVAILKKGLYGCEVVASSVAADLELDMQANTGFYTGTDNIRGAASYEGRHAAAGNRNGDTMSWFGLLHVLGASGATIGPPEARHQAGADTLIQAHMWRVWLIELADAAPRQFTVI